MPDKVLGFGAIGDCEALRDLKEWFISVEA